MKRWQDAGAKQFVASVAPGQEEEFMEMMKSLDESDVTIVDVVPDEVKEMVSLYQNSDSLSRPVILALFDHEKYTKDEIQNFFNCSKYRVDQARKWRKSCEGLLLPKKEKHHRNKLDLVKAEHFIDFVISSGLLQDVAYGTTNIQYDSGEAQKVGHVVLTSKYSHTIHFREANEQSWWIEVGG